MLPARRAIARILGRDKRNFVAGGRGGGDSPGMPGFLQTIYKPTGLLYLIISVWQDIYAAAGTYIGG
jgi:hypothetical protein